jgi:hypothetical protein
MNSTEITAKTETEIKAARRKLINEGRVVTLIGFDGSRNVYAFNVEPVHSVATQAKWDSPTDGFI